MYIYSTRCRLIHCCSASPKGYGQWIALELANHNATGGESIWIRDIWLAFGKLYDGEDKDNEVDPNTVIGTEIKPGKSYTIYSCGKEGSSDGTEGKVSIAELKEDGNNFAAIYWKDPWGSDSNYLEAQNKLEPWLVDVPGVRRAAIGHVVVKTIKSSWVVWGAC